MHFWQDSHRSDDVFYQVVEIQLIPWYWWSSFSPTDEDGICQVSQVFSFVIQYCVSSYSETNALMFLAELFIAMMVAKWWFIKCHHSCYIYWWHILLQGKEFSSPCLFIYISMDSWIPIISLMLSLSILCSRYPRFGQWESLQAGFSFLFLPIILWVLFYFLAQQDIPGSSRIFPVPAISPSSPGSFY